ncbi:protein AMBP-like [Nelusetta ayraudi]|uniref:protein AMBP-like n=1 Tax=Nelusetta ayraudi TaxID=303726 RepID=UPI003F71C440
MWKTASVLCLLALGSAWTMPVEPLTAVSAGPTKENFDLSRFMGRWYKVAMVSTCSHLMRRYSANPTLVTVELEKADSATNVTKTTSFPWDGVCKHMTNSYCLTETPGMFVHYSSRLDSDVESFVVETDYNDYAIIVMLSTNRVTGRTSKIVNLYSRSVDVTDEVLDDFKAQVTRQGLESDSIIMGQNQGECVADGPTLPPPPPPSTAKVEPQS